MTDDELVAAAHSAGVISRELDAVRIPIAGEVAERSRTALGAEGLAKKASFAKPETMLADLWGITIYEAKRLCILGLAIRSRTSFDGEPMPARYPVVAAAIGQADLGMDAAVLIVTALEEASLHCAPEARDAAEQLLVDSAEHCTVEGMRHVSRAVRDTLDANGPERRIDFQARRRALTMSTGSDGMVHLNWVMPPEIGGLVKAGIDTLVSAELRARRDDASPSNSGGSGGSVDSVGANGSNGADTDPLDDHFMAQLRSDAAAEIFRHGATCDAPGGTLPAYSMVIRMSHDALMEGLGIAEIDGIDEKISAGTARRLAADAELIPMVLGGASEALDVGRAGRLFSKAQRFALTERYGGCAFPGCTNAPAYTEVHHIQWWSKHGETNLKNGIPVCTHHHHQVHDFGWQIQMRDLIPWFVPPAHVDPDRTARRGGKG